MKHFLFKKNHEYNEAKELLEILDWDNFYNDNEKIILLYENDFSKFNKYDFLLDDQLENLKENYYIYFENKDEKALTNYLVYVLLFPNLIK